MGSICDNFLDIAVRRYECPQNHSNSVFVWTPFLFDSRRGNSPPARQVPLVTAFQTLWETSVTRIQGAHSLKSPLNGVVRQNYLTTVTISHFADERFVIRSLNGNEASLFSQMMGHRINSALYVKVKPWISHWSLGLVKKWKTSGFDQPSLLQTEPGCT